jgi:hypothetical protein
MGLMDRVREQAAQLAQKTQEAAQEGRSMLDQAQARRRADAMFRDLGAAVYAERTGRGGPDGADKIDRLIKALSRQEAEQGFGDSSAASPGDGPESPSAGTESPPAGSESASAGPESAKSESAKSESASAGQESPSASSESPSAGPKSAAAGEESPSGGRKPPQDTTMV